MISLILGVVGSIFISLLVVIFDKKKLKNIFKGMFTLSIFMLTWVPINIICILKKDFYWEPIKHIRKLDINSVI